ncbi:hypothetical protein DNU06_16625 [Putridiphycobacter roseus]|uniref:Uncharacterized protein n=1 Tax=Putridiphycobacter roseus TaxID=2219161 RepID=A0A2W1MYT5_9FLAO|nr:hypothetical protein [Putridiphycobacter roseus]PZE15721.1 hypothetical protein DNU06_16625 [Putridiphycobacter roseus]
MPSLKLIKISFVFCLLALSLNGFSQGFQTSKYKKEYNPYFSFGKFERGVNSDILAKKLDRLEKKDKSSWSLQDSMQFAEITLLTNNVKLSQYYLNVLLKNHPKYIQIIHLHLLNAYIQYDFETIDRIIKNNYVRPKNTFDDFFIAILNAQKLKYLQGSNVENIFDFSQAELKENKKGSVAYQRNIITPLNSAKKVLEYFVMYIHKDDPIIGQCFNEMGLILEEHVSLNQAYIAYSIARIYDKKDKSILENVKRIKAKHVLQNYNTPNFRKYFPRIEYWRFDYEMLKEKIIFEKNDTIQKYIPKIINEEKELIHVPFPFDAFIPIGIFFLFLIIIIFTKTKKNK